MTRTNGADGKAATGSKPPRDIAGVDLTLTRAASAGTDLDSAAESVVQHASDAAAWYWRNVTAKRWGAFILRYGAIIFTVGSGVVPIVIGLLPDAEPRDALWASVLLAIAAVLVGFDRFGGMSSGWTRYVVAGTHIRHRTDEFLVDWRAFRAVWRGGEPTPEQVENGYAKCRALVLAVNAIVADETAAWVVEFQRTIQTLDVELDRARQRHRGEAADQAGDGVQRATGSMDGRVGVKPAARATAKPGIE